MEKFIIFLLVIAIFLYMEWESDELFELFSESNEQIKPNEINDSESLISFDPQNVSTMTFRKNKFTSGNRTQPIEQLNCVGGNACSYSNSIDSVQCTNVGLNDSEEVQWKCTTDLPKNLSLGQTNVNCEGYKNSKDKLKLVNSCGLEYTLNNADRWKSVSNYKYNDYEFWVWIIVIIVLISIIYVALISPRPFYSPQIYDPYLNPYYRGYYSPPVIMSAPVRSSYLYSDSPSNAFKVSSGFGQTTTRG